LANLSGQGGGESATNTRGGRRPGSGRAPSTISRELRRNATGSGGYRPFEAHRRATARRGRRHRRRIETNGEMRQLVAELLAQRWSPQQISRHLRLKFPGEAGRWLCHESIYQAVYQPDRRCCARHCWHRIIGPRCAPGGITAVRISAPGGRRPRFEQPMPTIGQRPFQPGDPSQAGHWEGDLIIGKDQGSAIGTLVERQTRMVRLLYIPQRDGGGPLLDRLLAARSKHAGGKSWLALRDCIRGWDLQAAHVEAAKRGHVCMFNRYVDGLATTASDDPAVYATGTAPGHAGLPAATSRPGHEG
jgi:hypothetical protein